MAQNLTSRFNERLQENLARKKKQAPPEKISSDESDWETIDTPSDESDWETIDEADLTTAASQLESSKSEKSPFSKFIDAATTPLSGGYFGRKTREIVEETPERELVRHTGGQNKLQDFIAEVAAMGQGFKRGAIGASGDVVDMFTSPADIAALALGGGAFSTAARGLPRAANLLRRGTQLASIPSAIHGTQTALNPEESAMNRVFGGVEAALGAAGTYFPKSALPKPRTKTPIPEVKPKVVEPKIAAPAEELIDLPLSEEMPPVAVKSETPLARASDEELEAYLYHQDSAVQEEAAREMIRREEATAPPKTAEQDAASGGKQVKETPEEMTARMFPGMERGKSKFSLQGAKDFIADEKGEIDLSKLFQGEEDLGYSVRTNDPDAIDIGEVTGKDIDLEQEALRAGEETAKPVGPIRRFLTEESGEFNPDFMNEPGSQEFSPDLVQQADDAFGGTSPRFTPREGATPRSSFSQKIRDFLADETGAIGDQDRDPFGGLTQAAKDKIINRKFGLTEGPVGEAARTGMRRVIANIKKTIGGEDYAALPDDNWRQKFGETRTVQVVDDIDDAINYLKTQGSIERIPGQAAESARMIQTLEGLKNQANTERSTSFLERLRETLNDETGAVPRRPKAGNMWANLPDNVKATFEQAGIGPADIEGYSLKDISDTFDNFVRENAGLEPEVRTAPDKPQPTLIKPGGERIAPIDPEEAQIAQLTKDAMRAANRERDTLLRGGAEELSPEELESFRQQMQQGERFAEQVDTTVPQSVRDRTPLLRSKDYMEIPPESAKSSRRRASGLWGGVNDTFQQPQPKLENPLTPPKAESGQSAMERFIKSLYKDESGELNLEGLFGEAEPNQRPMPLLPDEASLQSGVPVRDRATGKPPEEQSLFGKIKDAPKGLMSMDLPFMTSAAFRQAKPLAWTSDWFKAWGTAARAYGSEEAYKAMEESWKQSKYFKPRYKPSYDVEGNITGYKEVPSPAEEIGVHLAGGKFGPAEEQIRAQLAEQIPGWGNLIKRSNRAYQAFINDLRVNKTTELLDQLEWTGTDNDKTVAKALGEFVNDATGRGSLKWAGPGGRQANLERIAPVLQNTMWSPRLFAANTKFLNPFTYTSLPDPVRRQYIGGALRMAGTWITFAGLAKMAGAAVSLDPTNSDFGKIKIGNTRVDPAGGMQQLMVFLAREAPKKVGEMAGFPTGRFTSSGSGKSREYGTGAFPIDRASVAEDFATSKLDPMSRLAYDIMRSSSKRPVHLGDRFVQMTLPIMAQDIADAMKEDPTLERLLGTSIGSSVGMGVNTYGKGERFGDPVFTDSIEQYLGQRPGSLRGTVTKW